MEQTTKIVIIGGKGTPVNIAEQIYDAQHRFGQKIEMLGFAFDDEALGPEINGFPVLCKTTEAKGKFEKYKDVKFLFSLYRSDKIKERALLRDSYGIPLDKFYTFIHPTAYVAKSASIGLGCVIQSNCVINPNVVIGNHNTFNAACLVGHDTVIGHSNFFAAHTVIGSGLTLKNYIFTGLNSSLRNMVTIQDNVIVGMASNVTKNVGENEVVVGNPAKPLKK